MPSTLAAIRLMISSTFTDCWTGSAAGQTALVSKSQAATPRVTPGRPRRWIAWFGAKAADGGFRYWLVDHLRRDCPGSPGEEAPARHAGAPPFAARAEPAWTRVSTAPK